MSRLGRARRRLQLAALGVAAAGCGPPAAGAPEVWRFAIEETRGSVQDAYATRFERAIERATGGAVDVVVYPYGALGTSDQLTELLHAGTIQLATASPGHLGKLIPELQVFLLHYVLPEDAEAARARLRAAPVRTLLDALYREKGLRFLSAFHEGWQVWSTRTPIRAPEDFRGVKMRVMTSPLLLAAYEAYGASATPLPYGQVYGALQLRMIDGQVNPIFAIEEMSFYEVTDHLVFAGQARFFTTVAANPGFVASLSPGRRALLLDTVARLEREIDAVQARFNEERLARILARKPSMSVVRLDAGERARFRAASAPVRARYVAETGPRGRRLLELLTEQSAASAGPAPAESPPSAGRRPVRD